MERIVKIKLHNSMAKKNKERNFMFNSNFFSYFIGDDLYIIYEFDDQYSFLIFSLETKEFQECTGFGRKLKDPPGTDNLSKKINWEEMNE